MLVVGEGFEPSLTANLANRVYKSRRATVTLPYFIKKEMVGYSVTRKPTETLSSV